MSQLNAYKVIRPIASGSFGRVKRKTYLVAEHIATGSKVALKILNKQNLVKRKVLKKIESGLMPIQNSVYFCRFLPAKTS